MKKKVLAWKPICIVISAISLFLPLCGANAPLLITDLYEASPEAYSYDSISDDFNDDIIAPKWNVFTNIRNGDSIMFIDSTGVDTLYIIQEGNAEVTEHDGVLILSDPINIEQYRYLLDKGYERYTEFDYDYAGIKRNFVGIDFDSLNIRIKKDESGNIFMRGQNYNYIQFIDKSKIEQDLIVVHHYRIKFSNENNDHYNIYFLKFKYVYNAAGELQDIISQYYYKKTIWDESVINNQEYIDLSYKKLSSDSILLMLVYADSTKYESKIEFQNNVYLNNITSYISPINSDNNPPYDTLFQPGCLSIDYIEYFEDGLNKDSSWLVVEHPNLIYECVDTSFSIIVKDGKRDNWPVTGAEVIVKENNRVVYEGVTNSLGICNVNDIYVKNQDKLNIEVTKASEQYTPYFGDIDVVEKYVLTYPNEFKTLSLENIEITLYMWDEFTWDTLKSKYIPDKLVPVPNAEIIINNEYDINIDGLTDANGLSEFNNVQTFYTKDAVVKANHGNYHDEANIYPYMWSYSQNATGPNNSNSITRDNETGKLYMMYSLYDPYALGSPYQKRRVIGAVSNNDGEWWQLYDLGYGKNVCLDKLESLAEPDMFWDELIGYQYSSSGYPNPITVSNGSAWVEPGSMWSDDVNIDYLQAAGISYMDAISPALIHMQIPRNDPENTTVDTLIDKDGLSAGNDNNYLIIPAHNPSIALTYNIYSLENDRLIAFEDKNSEICWIRYNSEQTEWANLERKSNSFNLKSINPYADAYGNNVSLVWQEEVNENTDDYRIYLNDSRFFLDNTETNKEYPKIKRNSYISYVENNNIKMWYYTDKINQSIDLIYSENNISYPDFTIKTKQITLNKTEHTVYSMYTEDYNGIYRIKTYKGVFTTNDLIQPKFDVVSTDTQIIIGDSPLYNYVQSSYNRPIERISSIEKGFDENKYYDIQVITTNNNNNEPYVLMLDGIETAVIYGRESDTLISIPAEHIIDNTLEITLDRTKGNPNRTAEFKVYEYDEVAEAGASAANMVQFNSKSPVNNYQFKVTSNPVIKNSAIKMTVELTEETIVRVSIYDIIGREVKGMEKKLPMGINTLDIDTGTELSGGVYFIKVSAGSSVYTDKLINLR